MAIAKKLGFENVQFGGGMAIGALRTCLSRKAETMQKSPCTPRPSACIACKAKRVLHAKGVTDIDEIRVDADPGQRAKMMEITGRRHRTADFHW